VAFSMAWREAGAGPGAGAGEGLGRLVAFRGELYRCLTARADALLELADAVLCADGPVRMLAALSLVPGHRRGHGAVYDAVNCGRIQVAWLRRALAGLPLPAWDDGRIRRGADGAGRAAAAPGQDPDRVCATRARGRGRDVGR
jgi:hypothetical protein